MITRVLDWLFDKFQASGAQGPLADRARARIRQSRARSAPGQDEVRDEPIGAPPLNRKARRASIAKRRKKR